MTNSLNISVELDNSTLIIKYPDVNYSYWKSLIPYDNDDDILIILKNILVNLDVSIKFSNARLLYTNQMMYEKYISDYYYYLLHLESQWLYNMFFNILIMMHTTNIQYELDNPIIEKQVVNKTKRVGKNNTPNKFIKQTTHDLITNKETYIYINKKTGEIINSDDGNLLDSLNKKKIKEQKEKKVKSIGVPMNMMTFSFKKKE